jgi:hypothetical protein
MALTDENGFVTTMPVAPAYGGGNGGFSNLGGDWGWIILLLLCAGGGCFNGYGGGYGNMMLGYDFPWLLNGQNGVNNNVSDGFRTAQLNDNITSVRDGISALSTQLCGCCGDMQMALANGFAGVEQGANARQMANMQQAFANQTAMMQGFNNIQSQFADCCCENRLANCQTQNIIQNEGNQTRFADANNTRDIIQSQTSSTQAILDKLCQLELDAKNDKINDLERQLTMANLAASQVEQTAQLRASQATTANQLVSELRSCPIPSQPVYGNQPIFTCPNNNSGCGCGCGNF